MPLNLVPPRKGRSQNWGIRGTYLGVPVDRSTRTPKKNIAKKVLREIETEIERGRLTAGKEKTFVQAVVAYLNGGGEKRFVEPLLDHFGDTPLSRIDQSAVDDAATILYPPGISEGASPHNATINRQVHTPVSAILEAGKMPRRFKRPKQPTPKARWITPEQADQFLEAAPPKLRRLATFLLHAGCRISESCNLRGEDWHAHRALAYIRDTKNDEARAVHLTPSIIEECSALNPKPNERVFGYRDRWAVYDDWNATREKAGLPDWFTPHVCCHTWATWMRQYAGKGLRGLLGTGRWKDLKSVLRYQHVVTTEESRSADQLPDLAHPKTKSNTDD